MSIGPLITLTTAIAVAAWILALIINAKRSKRNQKQTHEPHSGNTPNNSADIARSIAEGISNSGPRQ